MDYVQALRGIAALGVVLWHASRFISPYGTGLGTQLFRAGSVVGVDLFFIISGFIMVRTTRDNDGGLAYSWGFFVKRFARIWPIYVFWTIIYVAISFDLTTYLSSETNRLQALQSLTFVPFSSGGSSYGFPALNVGWTLNYEAYFYLIFGLSLLFGGARWVAFFGWMGFSLLVLPTILTGNPATLSHTNYGLRPVYLNIVCDPIVWFFISGVAIGLIQKTGITLPNRSGTWLVLSISLATIVWQYCSGFRMGHGIVLFGLSLIPFFLLLTLSNGLPGATIPRAFVFIGNVSYSLYLVHPLVQEGLERLLNWIGAGAYASGFSFLILTTVASIGLAAVSYRYLEQGLCNRIRDALLLPKGGQIHASSIKTHLAMRLDLLDQLRRQAIRPANLPFLILGVLCAASILCRLILIF